jgi:hypothetical protein
MSRRVGPRYVHDFGTCTENAAAQCRRPIFKVLASGLKTGYDLIFSNSWNENLTSQVQRKTLRKEKTTRVVEGVYVTLRSFLNLISDPQKRDVFMWNLFDDGYTWDRVRGVCLNQYTLFQTSKETVLLRWGWAFLKRTPFSVESSLQRIFFEFLLWKQNDSLVVSWRGKPAASALAGLAKANAER